MTQINKIEFKTVIIDGTERDINIITYSKENYSMYFSLQSLAQSINELLLIYGAREIFHLEFFERWEQLNLKCFTEFQLQLLIPINLIMEPSTEIFNPMPFYLSSLRYLNYNYQRFVENHSDHLSISNDIFCIAEKQGFTSNTDNHHKFVNSIGFLSLISILKLNFIHKLYRTFFMVNLLNSYDVEYIYETLILNRATPNSFDAANVFQINEEDETFKFLPTDLEPAAKHLFATRFNRACKIFKSFAFNIMDEQSLYISKNLQIVTQFGMNREAIENDFKRIPKITQQQMTEQQLEMICRYPVSQDNISVIELNILHSIIKIHLMIQRMTNVKIHKDDLAFYRTILKTRYSTDLSELLFDCPQDGSTTDFNNTDEYISYETVDGKNCLVKNYTIGEIIGEFIQLYEYAQASPNTIWLCKFIKISCNTRYSNLVNIMADFVPFFQRFFTHDFNINSINNLIIFLQGMCKPDISKIASLNRIRDIRQLDVRNFKSFSLTNYHSFNSNPLVTFIDLILTSKQHQKQQFLINMNTLSETERHNLITLFDPKEQQFIDYIYELEKNNSKQDSRQILDLGGNVRFNLQDIDYEHIVPTVSTNTFNENNITTSSKKLFNGILDQTVFFHELSNRTIYKIPGVVCNINIK